MLTHGFSSAPPILHASLHAGRGNWVNANIYKPAACPSRCRNDHLRPWQRPHVQGGSMCVSGDFSSSSYWNKLYTEESATAQPTEWHLNAEALNEPLERLLGSPTDDVAILNVGCGTSMLWARMYDSGWRSITNIDFSEACIAQGKPLSTDRPGIRWLVADACNLSSRELPDNAFHAAVDKGTLDAIACSEAFDWFLPRMARSLVRVLRPGGKWICVSFTPPSLALPLLSECGEWKMEVERLKSFWLYIGTKDMG